MEEKGEKKSNQYLFPAFHKCLSIFYVLLRRNEIPSAKAKKPEPYSAYFE